MFFDLKNFRLSHQLSQVQLAHESGVSLPTIQNIEAGKANPTVEVLQKLLDVFGLKFQILIQPFDAGRAATFGVPLLVKEQAGEVVVNKNSLKMESRKWLRQILEKKLNEREELAVIAFLKGVKDHYPKYYQNEIAAPLFDSIIDRFSNDGRVIKLRRIALTNMSVYL